MTKSYRLEDLDCANCAAKMEQAVQKVAYVEGASVNFMQQKLTLTAPDEHFPSALSAAEKVMRRIEPDVRVVK